MFILELIYDIRVMVVISGTRSVRTNILSSLLRRFVETLTSSDYSSTRVINHIDMCSWTYRRLGF